MKIEPILESIGLTEKEARVYIASLECGEASATELAKQSKLKRPTTYVILEQLVQKGLITKVHKKKVLLFRPEHPEVLFEKEKRKVEALKSALPTLLQIRNSIDLQPTVRVLQGDDAAETMLADIVEQGSDICWWGNDVFADKILGKAFEDYTEKRIKKGLWSRGITSNTDTTKRKHLSDPAALRELRVVPKDVFPMRYNVNIYGDTVSIVSFETQSVVMIKNADIAEAHRGMFHFAFAQAEKLQ